MRKKKYLQARILYPAMLSFTFIEDQKLFRQAKSKKLFYQEVTTKTID